MATNKQARARAQDARRRAAEMRKQQQAKERRRAILVRGGVVVAVLLVAGAIALVAVLGGDHTKLTGVKTYPIASAQHVTTKVNYPQNPPVGGEHNATWLNCGIYDSPVPNENAVHDLEHGAVWITYSPDLSSSDVNKLKSLVKKKTQGYLTLSPYPGLPAKVVASAWGKQLTLNSAGDKRLGKFIDKYQLGPQAPERGSSCSGGTGTPTG